MSSSQTSQTSSSRFSHKRADTYEGSQMSFQFPAIPTDKDGSEMSKLSGPPVQPYYLNSSPSSPRFSEGISDQYVTCSEASGSSFVSGESSNSVPSIPTNDNVSYQITENISHQSIAPAVSDHDSVPPAVPEHGSNINKDQPTTRMSQAYSSLLTPVEPQQHTFHSTHHNETKALPTPPTSKQSPMLRPLDHKPSMKRVKRTGSVRSSKNSDHLSLFTTTSLTRSKAIKYKIGWLSNLKLVNRKLFNSLKQSWRRIRNKSKKAVIKFKTRFNRTKAVEKAEISLPLERSQGKTIEELRRDMADWYVPETLAKVPTVPKVQQTPSPLYPTKQRISSIASIQSTINKISSPPLEFPKNRITSNPLIQKYIRQEELKKRLSSAPMTLTEHHYRHPGSMSDTSSRTSNVLMKGDEALVYEYLKVFLSNVISQRIQHKLEMYDNEAKSITAKTSNKRQSVQLSVPELEEDNESMTGSEYSHSDYNTQFTLSDYEEDEDEEEEENTSETSTTYYSLHPEDEILNDTLVKYQQTYVTGSLRRNPTASVKRSSTLPDNVKFKAYLQNNEIRIKNDIVQHSRYLSLTS
ncbi:hypothetical protein WICPIJ_008747 [Wickerhamomyces pijperi]|uniref:Altered inheritance of mitochondria protein 44 n=1 Tax=Wickerhamomyces pijperi TaxID=599730 RepID=A0A9P8THI4_WICPI|nr:hypothetical protein WICPIJ_008747 [Wickerhamomyces pijperi]